MSGAYGPPIIDQLPYIVKSLITDRTTRQAVLTIWRPRPYPSKDIPCTVSMQWLIRDDQLHCITNMRSNDIWLGAPYDIFTFSMVSNYLLLLINECTTSKVSLGLLYLNAASLHLYIQHWEEAEKAYSDIEWDHDELSLWKGNNENFKKPEGCVLIDDNNNILATGYNGVVKGSPHCNEGHPCPGAKSESGKDLDECYAIHAEQNALIQCKDLTKVYACFCTTAPCVMCTKLFLNTTLTRMIYVESYPQLTTSKSISMMTPLAGKLEWLQIPKERMKNVFNRANMATRE